MKIVLTGGGTGGHVFPLIAVAKKIREKYGEDTEFLYIGTKSKLEEKFIREENIPAKFIQAGKFRRYFSFLNITDCIKFPFGLIKSLWILLWDMPDVVFSKGGYVSLPVVIAARIYRIPVLVHESDAIPGMANRVLGKFSNRIAISYPTAERYFLSSKVLLTGNPIREDITQGSREKILKKFKLTDSKPIVVVMGGSQGSWMINQAVAKILPELLKLSQVIHQTGENTYQKTLDLAAKKGIKAGRRGYIPKNFFDRDEMKDILASADLVISRAGANSIAEIAANKKPTILIPLENSANDHQRMNAYEVAEVGGALVLEEGNLGENMLYNKVKKILFDEELKNKMGKNISNFYNPKATEKIVEGIEDLLQKN